MNSSSVGLSLFSGEIFSVDYGVNRGVPDGGYIGVFDTRTVSTALYNITSLKVRLKVSGTYNGDLYCYLVHGSGYGVLLNRVGRTSSNSFGYGDPGLEVTFDDGMAYDVHTYSQIVTGNENTPLGTYLMSNWVADGRTNRATVVLDTDGSPASLTNFNGLDPNGSWTIFLADLVGGDSHTLVIWGLEISGTEEPTGPVTGTISGRVQLQAYLGTTRVVRFIASEVSGGVTNYLTWK